MSLTEVELRTMRKSVSSAPSWLPTPTPAHPMALGADQSLEELSVSSDIAGIDETGLTSVTQLCNDNASPASSGEEESSLEDGEDGKSFGTF